MAQVQFYHLTSTPFERAVPKLLEKVYEAGYRVQCVVDSTERVDYLNDLLWTYAQNSFLPHGTASDGHASKHPILLTTGTGEAENSPDVMLITEGSTAPEPGKFQRVLDMFDGKNDDAVAKARQRWKTYKDGGHEVAYFRQTEQGGWEKKQ